MSTASPKFAERIDTLSASLVRFGVPAAGSYYQAHGMVHMVLRYCERHYTDWLGNAKAVDKALMWQKPPQVIAPAMEKAGLMVCHNSEYVFPYAWDLCSYGVKKKWLDLSRETYLVAKGRRLPVDNPIPADELTVEPAKDLFGDSINDTKKKPSTAPLGYSTIVEFWLREWSEKYGTKYTFRSRDGQHVKRLLQYLDGPAIQSAIRAYLGCSDRFYVGHELSGLYSGINRWVASDRPGGGEHGVAYAGADEDLPTAQL